jgi:hypothetical protein
MSGFPCDVAVLEAWEVSLIRSWSGFRPIRVWWGDGGAWSLVAQGSSRLLCAFSL